MLISFFHFSLCDFFVRKRKLTDGKGKKIHFIFIPIVRSHIVFSAIFYEMKIAKFAQSDSGKHQTEKLDPAIVKAELTLY